MFSQRREPDDHAYHVSYSKIQTLRRCGLQYRLRYVDGVRIERDLEVFAQGSVVHEVVERWFTHPNEDHREFILGAMEANGLRESKVVDTVDLIKATVDAVRSLGLTRDDEFEWPFKLKFTTGSGRTFTVSGTVDIVQRRRQGGDILFDLKTSRRPEPPLEQLGLYAWGYTRRTGRPVGGVGLIAPRLPEPVKVWDMIEVPDGQRLVADHMATLLGPEPYKPVPGAACVFCEFKRTPYCQYGVIRTEDIGDGIIAIARKPARAVEGAAGGDQGG